MMQANDGKVTIRRRFWVTGAILTLPLAACVTVQAPEKPIVINLNINIKQEVVYRLDGDAKALIENQGEIF